MKQRDSLATLTLDTLPFNIAVVDEDGTIIFTNGAWREFGGDDGDMVGANYFRGVDETDDEHAARAMEGLRQVIDGERELFELEYPCHSPERRRWFLMRATRLAGSDGGHVVVAHIDITQRKLAELRVREQHRTLERLTSRIEGLVRNVMEAPLRASSREELERTLCAQLAAVGPYVCAWIGRLDLRTETIASVAAAGRNTPSTEATLQGDADDPTAAAVRLGEMQVVDVTDPGALSSIHGPALDAVTTAAGPDRTDGTETHCTLAALPLVYGDTTYGVLTVYVSPDGAFDERELGVLDVLARVVSTAIHAIESRRILTTDSVVELELVLMDEDVLYTDVATVLDCSLAYEGSISHDDGTVTVVFLVHGADTAALAEYEQTHENLIEVTHVSRDEGTSVVEFRVADPPLVSRLAGLGVETTDIVADGRNVQLTVELPPSVDPRTVIEQFAETYPSIELVARREHKRRNQTKQELVAAIEEKLTDRQRLALQKAFLGGFFDW
ncbi:transcriptional regulator, partial [Halobacteriales archaeon QH_2_65_14]